MTSDDLDLGQFELKIGAPILVFLRFFLFLSYTQFTPRRRRRDSTVELSRRGVNWALVPVWGGRARRLLRHVLGRRHNNVMIITDENIIYTM